MTDEQNTITALQAEVEEKQKKILELSAAFEEQQIAMDTLNEKLSEVNDILELTGDERLSLYLGLLVDKLKERHDEAAKLRLDKKISEYTLTNLTFGFELAYLAKEAYALVIKEAAGLLEPVEDEEKPKEIVQNNIDEN
jgi:hypothetical protein